MSKLYDQGEKIVLGLFADAEKNFKQENCITPFEYILNHGYDNLSDEDIKAVAAYYGYPQPCRLDDPKYFFCHAPFGHVYQEILDTRSVIFVTGSMELHGASSNLFQDGHQCLAIAYAMRQKTGIMLAFPTGAGSHPSHHCYMPGTTIIPEKTHINTIFWNMIGLYNMGFRNIINLQNHGQEYVNQHAIHKFGKTTGCPAIIMETEWYTWQMKGFDPRYKSCKFKSNFVHADEAELSYQMATGPDGCYDNSYKVKTHASGGLPYAPTTKAGAMTPGISVWHQFYPQGMEWKKTPAGVVGDPTTASAEKAIRPLCVYSMQLHFYILESMKMVKDDKQFLTDDFCLGPIDEVKDYALMPPYESMLLHNKIPDGCQWKSIYRHPSIMAMMGVD